MNEAAPQPIELDLDETAEAGAAAPAPARDDSVDVDEATDAGEDEVKLPKGAVKLDGAATIGGAAYRWDLRFPVALTVKNASGIVKQETITSLTMHRLTADDMTASMNSGRDNMKVLILRSTRLPVTRAGKVYEKLDGADIAALAQIVSFLLEPGRKTGP